MSESKTTDLPVKILLIDDDEEEFILMKKQVAKIMHGSFALDWASNFETGVEKLLANQYDACFVDYFLDHKKNGIDLIREAVSGGCAAP